MTLLYKKLILYGSVGIIIISLIVTIIILKKSYKLKEIEYQNKISSLELTNDLLITKIKIEKDWNTITNNYTNVKIEFIERKYISKEEENLYNEIFNSYIKTSQKLYTNIK